ncbi:hypothetical protein L6654_39520 [Bradyrhizobium sp. WYCCWR 13023]|uniref:Uncharacterized protein n=1 Tax=Bradyrhizobium zhengyangense TaxID=2911009 RepID=A0A9X1RK99_9BRAD|nr:hypothetical protein [Bradyrhizobium zhengyangense]MCG2632693.1 hypothetical protein [Bradyrhizobium zhengyangense]
MHRFSAILFCLLLLIAMTEAQEYSPRIRRPPPALAEQERLASELVMTDGLLQKGDIVVTDHGYYVFQGIAADGFTNEFRPIPSPLKSDQKASGLRFVDP